MIRSMCMMCDGASLDEVRFHIHGHVERVGWTVVPVEGDRVARSYAYTIGLATSFDHPELVVTGLAPTAAGGLLNSLGENLRGGRRYSADEEILVAGHLELRLAKVHFSHFVSGKFAMWVDYYGALGPPRPEPRALEIVFPGRTSSLRQPRSQLASARPRQRRRSKRKRGH